MGAMKRAAILGAMLGAVACAKGAYVPEEAATATLGGRTAAQYSIPSDAQPQGTVRVASYGISKLKQEREGKEGRAIHVRMAVQNHGQGPFVVDIPQQRVQFSDGSQVTAAYAHSDQDGLPVVEVAPGSSRTVDLFFPIPEPLLEHNKMPDFSMIWRVQADGQEISRITPFDKMAVDPNVARQEAYAYGPYGWYDPYWGPAWIGSPWWWW